MTLTAGQLAPLAASAKTEIDRVIALPLGTATLSELLNAKQAGYDMGIDTYDGLDAHIQYHVDNSAGLSTDDLQRLRFITMPARIRAIHEDNPINYDSSQSIIIPDDCHLLKVSFQAKGGDSGASARGGNMWTGGGGGGGGYVSDYEMVVTPGDSIQLIFGDTLSLGALTVEQGGIGGNYNQAGPAGTAGRVLWNGQEVDDGVTAIGGTDGMAGTLITAQTAGQYATTSNGKKQGAGGGNDETFGNYYGVGGGACGSNDGEDLISIYAIKDTRTPLLGAGASSSSSTTDSNYNPTADLAVASQPGGPRSPYVIINFVKQPA